MTTVKCPFCSEMVPANLAGTTRCNGCRRMFHVERDDRGVAMAVAGEHDQLPRYVEYEQLSPYGEAPARATMAAAGYDLAVLRGGWVWPGQVRVFDTGVRVYMPSDVHVDVRQRSGWFKHGLLINPGLVDADFQESIKVIARNVRLWPIHVRKGDRLAQLVLPNDMMLTQHGQAYTTPAPIAGRQRVGGIGSTGRGR